MNLKKRKILQINLIKIAVVVIISIFMFLSYFRYKDMYSVLDAKWHNEEKGVRFYRGILLAIALPMPLFVLIVAGIYW